MFPIRDDNPKVLTPYATYAIALANVAAWVLVQGMGTEPYISASVCRLGLIPGELLGTIGSGVSVELGPDAVCVLGEGGRWHTALTSMFLHGGWFHLIGNMWFLWIFGDNVEGAMGHGRFVVFYVLSGLAAAVAQVWASPGSAIPMVGASGAIGGVMGAYVVLYPRVHVHMLVPLGFFITTVAVPAFLMLGYWFVIQLVGGFGTLGVDRGGVAFWAHVGGFAAGVVLVFLLRNRRLLDQHPYHGWTRSPTRNWHRVD